MPAHSVDYLIGPHPGPLPHAGEGERPLPSPLPHAGEGERVARASPPSTTGPHSRRSKTPGRRDHRHRRRCVITRRQPGRRRVGKDAAAAGFHEVTRLARDLLSNRACNSPSATVRSMKGARGRRRPCTYLASHSTRPTKHDPTIYAFLDVLPERLTASLSQLSRRQPPAALCMLDRRAGARPVQAWKHQLKREHGGGPGQARALARREREKGPARLASGRSLPFEALAITRRWGWRCGPIDTG